MMVHVGTVVASGEDSAYKVAAFVRDNLPTGCSHRFSPSDLGADMELSKEEVDLADLYEIDLEAPEGRERELEDWILAQDWDALPGMMWSESLLEELSE